jgi:signal transduction histidine kinase
MKMEHRAVSSSGIPNVGLRAESLFTKHRQRIFERTDRMFAGLMIAQWAAAIVVAAVYSPYAWKGDERSTHVHLYAAVFLGAAISSLPVGLAVFRPGEAITRHVIAIAQMLWSALFIHLTGGRIETHFHVFGSLTFLAFYRDWKVLPAAGFVVALDHFLRGMFWPESVYGVSAPEWSRFLEHAGWVVYIQIFLIVSSLQATREMREIGSRHALVEAFSERAAKKSAELDTALVRLERSRAILSSQSEASMEGVLIVGSDGKAIFHNRRYAELWGIPSDVMARGAADEMIAYVLPKVCEPSIFHANVRKHYADPTIESNEVIRLLDGRVLERHTTPIRTENGIYYGRGWFVRDVTARERAEEELRRRVAERTADLERANAQLAASVAQLEQTNGRLILADRLVSLGHLSAGIAHEINNPLAYILGNVEHVRSELQQKSGTQDLIEALDDAIHGAERVSKIVGDLKVFARSDEEQKTSVDMREVVESACKMAMPKVRHRARFVFDLREVPPVLGDAARLGQVFLNLVINAAQAMTKPREGGHQIRVSTRLDSANQVVVEVADTGDGIPEDLRVRIFDPFFTTKEVGVGTGLGLSICHGIVASHDGEISVESRPGEGTRFRVVLPMMMAATDAPRSTRESGEIEVAVRRHRVLVIDDEPKILDALRRALAPNEVAVISSGAEAVARIEAGERFDAILCDIMMPGMTGMDVHVAIERLSPEQASKMIFITGGAVTDDARAFLSSLTLPCIEKPFRPGNVKTLVASICDRAA